MHDIANQTCNELTQRGEINVDVYKKIIIKILVKNHEKINKYYDTLGDEGFEKFTTNLTNTLLKKCDVFKEFMNKKKI